MGKQKGMLETSIHNADVRGSSPRIATRQIKGLAAGQALFFAPAKVEPLPDRVFVAHFLLRPAQPANTPPDRIARGHARSHEHSNAFLYNKRHACKDVNSCAVPLPCYR